MNWHRRCRLCLAESPLRPVHALQTPKLFSLLKDLCNIEIDINDNMDLVCTNCVQVISSLKFFISNQKVIKECRDSQKMLMVIKEENESSDCVVVDHTEDIDSNKNGPKDNMKIDVIHESATIINKSTLTESILSAKDLQSTTKRRSSTDDHSEIYIASDEDTLDNEICSNTEINTITNSCDDHPPKLKKCKIILSRIETVESQRLKCPPCPKNKDKTKNNAESVKTTTTTGSECTLIPINHADQRKPTTTTLPQKELYLTSTKEKNITKSLKLPSSILHKTPDSCGTSELLPTISDIIYPINITKNEIPKTRVTKQVSSINENPGTKLNINKNVTPKTSDIKQITSINEKSAAKLANSFASKSEHNMSPNKNNLSTSKDQNNLITSLHNKSANDLQSNNCCSMKVLTVNELHKKSTIKQPQSKKVIGVVNPNNTNLTADLCSPVSLLLIPI